MLTRTEKIKYGEELLNAYKREWFDNDFSFRFNISQTIASPQHATQIDQMNRKLTTDKIHLEKLITKLEREINEWKLQPLEEDLKNKLPQDEKN